MEIFLFSEMVEENGKTVRENRMAIQHKIPIGTLVEVKYDTWFGDGACEKVHARLWVAAHLRDCDGTPLYGLETCKGLWDAGYDRTRHGFGEEQLTPVEVTPALVYGTDALEWPDDAEGTP